MGTEVIVTPDATAETLAEPSARSASPACANSASHSESDAKSAQSKQRPFGVGRRRRPVCGSHRHHSSRAARQMAP